jgi:nucleolar protein 53
MPYFQRIRVRQTRSRVVRGRSRGRGGLCGYSVLNLLIIQGSRQKPKKRLLRVDEILQERSKVAEINFNKAKPKKKAGALLTKVDKYLKTSKPEKPLNPVQCSAIQDIWTDSTPSAAVAKMPSRLRPPKAAVVLDHLDIPHSGTSYNPQEDHHQELIKVATKIELKRLEKESIGKDINKRALVSLHKADADVSMPVDLSSDDEEEHSSVVEAGEASKTVADPSVRKTRAQRNKERREKEESARQEEETRKQNLLAQVDKIDEIKKEIEQPASKKVVKKEVLPERVSTLKFAPLAPVVALSDELPSCLRELRPEGNLFKDRFNMLQKRNLVETRLPAKKRRRYAVKVVEKHSFKNFK